MVCSYTHSLGACCRTAGTATLEDEAELIEGIHPEARDEALRLVNTRCTHFPEFVATRPPDFGHDALNDPDAKRAIADIVG